MGLPTSINVRQYPTGMTTGHFNTDFPSFRHSSQTILSHVTLAIKAKQQDGYTTSQDGALSSMSKDRPWHENHSCTFFHRFYNIKPVFRLTLALAPIMS